MATFGGYGAFPRQFGAGDELLEIEHQALLDAYAPGWDTSDDTEIWQEAYAEARAVSMIWAVNERVSNQLLPLRMLENLTVWEEACGLRPTRNDLDVERRKRVAAKLRALSNNSVGDIEDALRAVLGDNFAELLFVDSSTEVTYWPVINPGPPGWEWSSNKAILVVRMTRDGLTNAAYFAKRAAAAELLDGLLPAWMSYEIGVGTSGFIADVGIVGVTFI